MAKAEENVEEKTAAIFKYSVDIPINRLAEEVWPLLFSHINDWWMNDYRALGSDSQMSFSSEVGSSMIESGAEGEALEWYRVQMVVPGKSIYLVGHLAPEWGGPATTMLKLALTDTDKGCLLTVSDALLGDVSASMAGGTKNGWREIFDEGFRRFVETT